MSKDTTMKMTCELHGESTWERHVLCPQCHKAYHLHRQADPCNCRFAGPHICACGADGLKTYVPVCGACFKAHRSHAHAN